MTAETLFKDFFEWRLRTSPEFSTCIGFKERNAELESYSLQSFEESKLACTEFLRTAKELLSATKSKTEHENLVLLVEQLQTFLDGSKYNGYAAPLNYFEGPHLEFRQILSYMPKNSLEDFSNIIDRYLAFPKQVEEIIELMQYSILCGTTVHSSSMKGVLEQFSALQVPVETSPFYEPFLSMPVDIPSRERSKLQSEALLAVEKCLLPAFKKLAQFLESEYLLALRPEIAATSLPDGQRYYRQLLKFHLSCDLSPEEIHETGLREVERISTEMHKVIEKLGIKLSLREFTQKIKTDPQFFYSDKNELLKGYEDISYNQISPKMATVFNYLPKTKLSIIGKPSSEIGGLVAFYQAGSQDGTRPGVFCVNETDLKSAPKYEMMSLALHEGVPGHHLQTSYMIEQPGIPDFRRYIEDRKYCTAPAKFPINTAYGEGWALYCEYLGEELGLYEDPYSLFGRLSEEMLRACRLVVDTGMHYYGWDIEKAVTFMMDNTAATRMNIEKEVARYIAWPGQACGYKIGELKIKSLRAKAEKALGEKFDIKEFHDAILRSAGPLSFMEAQVAQYIASFKQ